jgi:uncharacterized membrane protein
LCLSAKLDNLSCSFTSISFLITSCSVTLCLSIKSLRHKVTEQLVIRKDMDINEHERLSYFTLRHKVNEQLVIRKDMDVNEHERLSNFPYPFLLQAVQLLCV